MGDVGNACECERNKLGRAAWSSFRLEKVCANRLARGAVLRGITALLRPGIGTSRNLQKPRFREPLKNSANPRITWGVEEKHE